MVRVGFTLLSSLIYTVKMPVLTRVRIVPDQRTMGPDPLLDEMTLNLCQTDVESELNRILVCVLLKLQATNITPPRVTQTPLK